VEGSNSDIACKIECEPHCSPSSRQTVAQPATSALTRQEAVCEGQSNRRRVVRRLGCMCLWCAPEHRCGELIFVWLRGITTYSMHFCNRISRRFACAVFVAVVSLACHAQSALTPAQALSYRRIGDLHFSLDGARLVYVVYSYQWDWQPRLWLLDVVTGRASDLTPAGKSERSPQWSPAGPGLAFVSNRDGKPQVYVMATDESAPIEVTAVKYGVSNFHWSPDGKSIAYLAKSDDSSASDTGPQVADRESDLSSLWVVDLATKTTHRVGIAGYRVREFQWQTTAEILVAATDKPRVEEFTDAIYSVSISDGKAKLVSTPPQPFDSLLVSPDGKQFAVRSTRENGPVARDLFLGTVGREDLRDVSTTPDLAVAEVKWHDQSAIWVRVIDGFSNRIFRFSTKAAPAPIHLPVSVDSFDVSRAGLVAFAGGDFDHLPELYLMAKDGSVRQLAHVQQGWDGLRLASTVLFRTKSFDGTEIESALMKPAAPHPGEKMPLVLLVHGGPSSNFSAGYGWETGCWAQLLAARGYEVLMVNPRGSNGYSEEFVKANRSDLGGGDYQDLMTVLDSVLAKGETDPNRLGIGGWSYGAEMSVWAITQSGRFKAAVAGAGVFDQQAEFETEDNPADDEWQFGTPWEHADVFARNSPATYIRNAHTPTLILAGEDDTSNPVGQSKGLYRALKHFGVETAMVLYPGEGHSPRSRANNIDMFERILNWYDRFLRKTD
jgi:dipeptidyl aminopeptidase/acylaminoacyl peptidase